MKKLKKIPTFKSLADEEKFWSTHDTTDYVDFSNVELGFFPELKPSSKTISIRLPESLVEAIKILANKQDIPYQSMLKILLAEKVRDAINLGAKKAMPPDGHPAVRLPSSLVCCDKNPILKVNHGLHPIPFLSM